VATPPFRAISLSAVARLACPAVVRGLRRYPRSPRRPCHNPQSGAGARNRGLTEVGCSTWNIRPARAAKTCVFSPALLVATRPRHPSGLSAPHLAAMRQSTRATLAARPTTPLGNKATPNRRHWPHPRGALGTDLPALPLRPPAARQVACPPRQARRCQRWPATSVAAIDKSRELTATQRHERRCLCRRMGREVRTWLPLLLRASSRSPAGCDGERLLPSYVPRGTTPCGEAQPDRDVIGASERSLSLSTASARLPADRPRRRSPRPLGRVRLFVQSS
jgi:hypothetical protein